MSQKGFSIVEILVATAIIGSVVLGVFSLLGPAIKMSLTSSNMLAASMLAQEGIELTMNIRDTNWWKTSVSWDTGLGEPGNNPFAKIIGVIDYSYSGITYANNFGCANPPGEKEVFECVGTSVDTRMYTDSNGFYGHTRTSIPTAFRRAVIINRDTGNNRLIVTSIVRWGAPDDASKEVRLVTYLYNWMP